MEAVDVCEKCEVSDWNSEDFMDESAFSCSGLRLLQLYL